MKGWSRATIAVLLLCLAGFQTAGGQDIRIQKAKDELKEARKKLDDSRAALEDVYLKLEGEFQRIHGPYAAQFVQSLERAWSPIMNKVEEAAAQDRALAGSRRRVEDFAAPLLQEAAKRVLDLDPRVLIPLVDQASQLFYEKLRQGRGLAEGEMESQLSQVLAPGIYFHEYWNRNLFTQIEEAHRFAQANEEFDKARVELDRLEHPERYTTRGKLAPSRMVYVPGGMYTVGPNTGWERGKRKVSLREFYIDKYEITNQEYNSFLREQDPALYNDYVPYFWPKNQNLERVYPEDQPNEPVQGVSWKAANDYARWCGKRLPTEEEWEVAARGKQGYIFPWGDKFDASLCNTSELGFHQAVEVGSFPKGASPFGCLDMAGNVYEWTATDDAGATVKEYDNKNIRNMVIRGGDYQEDADHARGDFRWMTPMDPYAGRNPTRKRIGFRCAKDVE